MPSRGKRWAQTLLNWGPRWICRYEFRRQTYARANERPVEFAFVFRQLARLYPRSVLDIGTGTTALPHLMRNCGFLVTATDNIRDYWPSGMVNRHYHVIDDDITNTRLRDEYDLITCVSVLEHIEDHAAAVRNMFKLLKPQGHLVLSFPYTERAYVRNVYELPGSGYGRDFSFICQSYSRREIDAWLKANDGVLVEQEFWQFWRGDFWTVGDQVLPPLKVGAEDKHQITCLLLRKRG